MLVDHHLIHDYRVNARAPLPPKKSALGSTTTRISLLEYVLVSAACSFSQSWVALSGAVVVPSNVKGPGNLRIGLHP